MRMNPCRLALPALMLAVLPAQAQHTVWRFREIRFLQDAQWDARTGTLLLTRFQFETGPPEGSVEVLRFNPRSDTLEVVTSVALPAAEGFPFRVSRLAVQAGGGAELVVSGGQGFCRLVRIAGDGRAVQNEIRSKGPVQVSSLAVAPDGQRYILDARNLEVARLVPAGKAGDAAGPAWFERERINPWSGSLPQDLSLDPDGNLVVAEGEKGRITLLKRPTAPEGKDWEPTALAGSGGRLANGDGHADARDTVLTGVTHCLAAPDRRVFALDWNNLWEFRPTTHDLAPRWRSRRIGGPSWAPGAAPLPFSPSLRGGVPALDQHFTAAKLAGTLPGGGLLVIQGDALFVVGPDEGALGALDAALARLVREHRAALGNSDRSAGRARAEALVKEARAFLAGREERKDPVGSASLPGTEETKAAPGDAGVQAFLASMALDAMPAPNAGVPGPGTAALPDARSRKRAAKLSPGTDPGEAIPLHPDDKRPRIEQTDPGPGVPAETKAQPAAAGPSAAGVGPSDAEPGDAVRALPPLGDPADIKVAQVLLEGDHLRMVRLESGESALQCQTLCYRDKGGVQVAVVSMVHLGTPGFFQAVQRYLAPEALDAVLCEGTFPEAEERELERRCGPDYALARRIGQGALTADALGLVLQWDVMRLGAAPFRFADLQGTTLEEEAEGIRARAASLRTFYRRNFDGQYAALDPDALDAAIIARRRKDFAGAGYTPQRIAERNVGLSWASAQERDSNARREAHVQGQLLELLANPRMRRLATLFGAGHTEAFHAFLLQRGFTGTASGWVTAFAWRDGESKASKS